MKISFHSMKGLFLKFEGSRILLDQEKFFKHRTIKIIS